MVLSQVATDPVEVTDPPEPTAAKKRRLRRKKLQAARSSNEAIKLNIAQKKENTVLNTLAGNKLVPKKLDTQQVSKANTLEKGSTQNTQSKLDIIRDTTMSSKELPNKARDDVLAAREAKKLAKLKAKNKGDVPQNVEKKENVPVKEKEQKNNETQKEIAPKKSEKETKAPKCRDEVDRAIVETTDIAVEKTKEQILTERAAKKAAKQAKKKGEDIEPNQEMTVKDVVETLKDIKNVAKEVQDITAKVSAIHFEDKKEPEEGKSKAELRAERRAKQEAQRAKKQAEEQKAKPKPDQVKPKPEPSAKSEEIVKERSPKPKSADKNKTKPSTNKVNWFQHLLHTEHDKESLNRIPINSNLHPAIVKLGVQLATRVVTGSNARCVALLNALKMMVRDYTLPAKTEFARGLEAHLAASLDFLWSMRQPSASQTNAVKFFRLNLTQLPNNVDEFDAKKTLQEEIDKYIGEEIDKAGEAISMAVRQKISTGDNILTYGCSSLIERILREAWEAKVHFRTVVVGNRVHGAAREMLRRLVARGLPCTYVDITAISFVMKTINKVVLGAGSVLVNGSVLGAVGSAQVALVARACNVPVLVACETHKFSERVQADAFVYNEIGDPDELIDKSDDNSPLKDWRSNPNLTLLNLTYDVTPPSLVTAVVTEKAILPCTSAPVVLRTKISKYGF